MENETTSAHELEGATLLAVERQDDGNARCTYLRRDGALAAWILRPELAPAELLEAA